MRSLASEGHGQGSDPRILLGIASDSIRAEVQSALGGLGPSVAATGDGYHLIQLIADAILGDKPECRPSLIVIDSLLHGCTGLSLVAGLRELGWDTPVILLTPKDDEQLRRKAWDHGATGVFMAPFDTRELSVFAELILDIGLHTGFHDPRRPRKRRGKARLERLGGQGQAVVNG